MWRAIGNWLNRYKSVFFLAFAGLLLLLAQSARWNNQTIFNKQAFTSIASSVLQTEETRQAVASTVVDKALVDKPILKRTISTKATQLITGLLSTDLAQQTTSGVVSRSYDYVTSENPEPITIDLVAIKTPMAGLISFAEQQGREVTFDPATIPDSIELFNPETLPDFYKISMLMLILGPLCWIGSAIIFGSYIYRGRLAYAKRVYIVGTIIIISSLIGLLAGPLVIPPIVARVPVTSLRGVVEDLIYAFIQPFNQQLLTTISLTLLVLLIFNQRFNILGLVQRFTTKSQVVEQETKKKQRSKSKRKK